MINSIVKAQKNGEALGITSICSSNQWVLRTALNGDSDIIIESTCNQVNQYGGYSGMTPSDFIEFVQNIAKENHFPKEKIIFGGDHLGPNPWKNEPAYSAMNKSKTLIRDYIKAGYRKLHLDCSMLLLDDLPGSLEPELIAQRTAQLAKVAEDSLRIDSPKPWYIIGSEVPTPGGLQSKEEQIHVTNIEDVKQTLEITKKAFSKLGLDYLWERIIAIVVQPGVEFGDDFAIRYDREKTLELSNFIETEQLIYEAHSTDYQTKEDLAQMVEDHFAILKVGPALTYAFRDAMFLLARIEDELIEENKRSNLVNVIDDVMIGDPKYWKEYYTGNHEDIAKARKYSLSDRIRYYWNYEAVIRAINTLFTNLNNKKIPNSFIKYQDYNILDQLNSEKKIFPQIIIASFINKVLFDYMFACGLKKS